MRIFSVSVIILLILGVVAVQAQYYSGYIGSDGYSGYDARERRLTDPYSRENFFGQDYYKPYQNFGSKGPTNRLLNTGSKSAYAGAFTFDTNAFSARGRDPSKISNNDPGMRGYQRQDSIVYLEPFGVTAANREPIVGKGTARIISKGDERRSQNDYSEFQTQVYLQTQNLPPLPEDEVYEAWMFDDESEYALSIGVFTTSIKLTHQLVFEIQRSLLPFDAVMVTREKFADSDPRPGEIVLYGDIVDERQDLSVSASHAQQWIR